MEFKSSKEFRKISRQQLKGNWIKMILIIIIFTLICLSYAIPYVGYPIQIIISGALVLGFKSCFLKVSREEKIKINDLFSGFKNFIPSLVLQVLIIIFTFLWSLIAIVPAVSAFFIGVYYLVEGNVEILKGTDPFKIIIILCVFYIAIILLLIPAMIAMYRYSMSYYILADSPNIGGYEALRESKRMMEGNKWRLFCLHISFIGWWILSFTPSLIGGIVIAMLKDTSNFAVMMLIGVILLVATIAAGILVLVYGEAANASFYNTLKSIQN
ncbi:DUF975 family protein [Clostridium felsineum]|uniref:DUF975 family protein n=1 Tax=Clostridium felsineum TaxID=36839 RepID=UPI00214D3EEE|nr:DUF975 family protein [Clostridium felsineum]MCR3759478.1 DUF975 family protein [Clostridium felsineum]